MWAAPSPRFGPWLYRSGESEPIGKHTHSCFLYALDCGYQDLTASSFCSLYLPAMIGYNSAVRSTALLSPTLSLCRMFNTVTQVALGHLGLPLIRGQSLLYPFCLCRILMSFSLVIQGSSHCFHACPLDAWEG